MLRLHFERSHRKLSQAQVARAARIPQPYVSAIERGRLVPTADELQRLAAVFGVPPGDLLKDVAVAR